MTTFTTQALANGASQLAIDGEMTIYDAIEIKHQLLEAIQQSALLELDLSHVTKLDTAGFQLLIMAKRESQRQNREIKITAHSDAVREVIEFCNMSAFFGDPMVIPAEERKSR